MTGLAQWASISFKLYRLTNDKDYLLVARKTLYYLKSKQFKEDNDLKGALPGSVPFWGVYAPYSAINWGVKFFIDALVENEKYKLSLIEDSNLWIGECFRFESHVVDDSFTETSKEYLKTLEIYINKSDNTLDLGCGKGKYIRYFQNMFRNKNINGIDPYFYDDDIVKKGDVYNIDFDKKFDLIYTIEVLQHVKYLDTALQEIYKHLSEDGVFIICDRNPNSFIGHIKSIQEYRGKWMYPFDSPFTEKWYSISKWQDILNQNSFIIDTIKTFNSKNGKLGWINKYNIIIARKNR
jgi:ubiquinone/menaquinone biosynthesis C-methylase UbiE